MKIKNTVVLIAMIILGIGCQNLKKEEVKESTEQIKDSLAIDAPYQFTHTNQDGELKIDELRDIPLNVDLRTVRRRGSAKMYNPYQLVHIEVCNTLSFGILAKFSGVVGRQGYNNQQVRFMPHTIYPIDGEKIEVVEVVKEAYDNGLLELTINLKRTDEPIKGTSYRIKEKNLKRNTMMDIHLQLWDEETKEYVSYKACKKEGSYLFGDRACTVNLSY